ncbi:ABC-F family ATP-binding cassette domain-containing protein [Tumebacillus permanentifrigoris]|uniref:ATPase subunit of ABC transporter with duplicated ATPase domains n=1 Tax=Tumebacillus permanentifrigoris TaxID=378543 RepID=A0A316DW15_9BACL|nr:ABC-F family ATP-binding cassette domain-containing protein [Tumebacillus permanentifrigoris]PWK13734.1 ATPase subunit of ABC transporter with duplicated ATPase domains [Tumebacillus permanentifrigoris]
MSILNVTEIGHGFGARNLFANVNFRLLNGEHVGLVGANGTGKSTLMNILTGKLQADNGKLEWSSRATVGYLDQHASLQPGKSIRDVLRDAFKPLFDMEQELGEIGMQMAEPDADYDKLLNDMGEIQDRLDNSGFYMIDAKVEEVAKGLGLNAVGLDRDVADLSGGQRTKTLLAKLLLEQPNVLLLDEPTNHLDVEHIEWLTTYLQNYPYAFILISHDVEFMDSVVNIILHLEGGKLDRYAGNYEKFVEVYLSKRAQQENAFERQQEEIKRMESFIQRNKARASTSGRAKSRQKLLDKIDRIDKPVEYPRPSFRFEETRLSSKLVFEAKDLVIGYDRPLLPPLTFKLERGEKIAITGMNGMGKSTLIKTILGQIPALGGSVDRGDYLTPIIFEQEVNPTPGLTALEDVWNAFPHLQNQEVRANLARCGLGNDHITSKLTALSGGEHAKVRLCKLMLTPSNWMLFDEPTNHLDVVAKEELAKTLQNYRGTVLIVCHEPEFYKDWVTQVWNVEDWAKASVK